jgi:hypothetical protein
MLVEERTTHTDAMRPLVNAWVKLGKRANDWKKAQFQDDADDIQLFFNGCKDDFWSPDYSTGKRGFLSADSKIAPPDFQMKVMKVAEAVEIFGPRLYANNPTVAVNPRKWTEAAPVTLGIPPEALQPQMGPDGQPLPPNPFVEAFQQRQRERGINEEARRTYAMIHRDLLNYEQIELDKQSHMRRIIDEALIMGMGVGWTEWYEYPDSNHKLVGTFYDSVRNLLLDPDASCWEDLQWVGRKRSMPYWEAEEMFGYKPGSLRQYATKETLQQQEFQSETTESDDRKRGDTCDLIEFTEYYSKFGVGEKLRGVPEEYANKPLWAEKFPRYCYLAICERCPYPLNLPPDTWTAPPDENGVHEVTKRAEWPIPFWKDNRWPCVPVVFHPVPDQLWPMSHFKPALGEIQWVTWCLSFMANKVRTSCGTMLGILAAAKSEVEEQLEKPGDNKIIWLADSYGVKDIKQLMTYLQQPEFHQDLWNMLQAMMNEIDKRLGTVEALYGMGGQTQDRSATESDIKNRNAGNRIDDMARNVESALTYMCRNEAIGNWYWLEAQDVADILGPDGTQVWVEQIKTQPLDRIVGEFDFEIVAGSTRKMNKEAKAQLMNQAMQVLGPAIQNFAAQGIVDPWNALVLDWANANDVQDPERYLVQLPEPQPDPKVQAEMQKMQAEQQMAQEAHQMEMQKSLSEMEMKKQELMLKQQEQQVKLAVEIEKQRLQLQIMREKAQLEMEIERMKAQQSMQVEQVKAAQSIEVEQAKAESQAQIAEQQATAKLETDKQMADAKVEQTKQVGKAQVETAKAKAKATPKKKPAGDK